MYVYICMNVFKHEYIYVYIRNAYVYIYTGMLPSSVFWVLLRLLFLLQLLVLRFKRDFEAKDLQQPIPHH